MHEAAPMVHLDWPFFDESHRVLAAAWLRDEGATVTSEAAMAKMVKGNRS
jgi:hypothetical protein